MRAFYHADERGIPINPNVYSAYLGFSERGYETVPFTTEQMMDGGVAVEPDTPVAGGIPAVKHAWKMLGVTVPPPIDYPAPLRPFLERDMALETYGGFMARYTGQQQVFVKPADQGKLFTGAVLRKLVDSVVIPPMDPDAKLWVAGLVRFVSEWRVFVLDNTILDARPYKGDPLVAPERRQVEAMIATWAADTCNPPPTAYALDAGVIEAPDGSRSTALVEVNDAYALGAYGLHPLSYSRMIAVRWAEVVGIKRPAGL